MLEVKNIHTYYGNIQALKGVSIYIKRGEICTLIGSNGAGKTTLLRTIQGLIRPHQGTILFEGIPIETVSAKKIVRQLHIAQSPEGRMIFPRMTVLENLQMGAFSRKDKIGIKFDLEYVLNLFPRLRERISQKGGTLSGGEQQMLAIARALMAKPRLLLLDEPSMGLAPNLVQEIFSLIKQINKERGTTILLVEQNARQALDVATRGYVLRTGKIEIEGRASDLQTNEEVRKAYLGED
ncbi:ABC transporter ATP-binding protein [Dulcicalothrix desertica PCC 7102]|uniref:ABC transporter ATP-binding protein n=1 Tax=Dulcicalothrix desertica PCC 7102 TaxID=232991 RepID=A0A433VE75_9CYAN|nr:ABC transporter ATP-binding protein [Dulcicalothrix desertica]RUT04388.1 ABC transporter ATP-binding protein [Dulcicalothrix desertica PCC 7102]TWH51243.1 branched-chain amino acid transport system ATP-binding protein [Dulcicalothrix desertica PCC 7102]